VCRHTEGALGRLLIHEAPRLPCGALLFGSLTDFGACCTAKIVGVIALP
jgi:hypothetical protein